MSPSEALLTDLYQLTMAQAAWASGRAELEASFYAHFRKNPFEGGYAVACGAASIAAYLENFAFTKSDLAYLESIPAADGSPLFNKDFLASLGSWRLAVDIDCVPEGTVVFAQEPLMRVSGPLSQCLLLETPLLNKLGFETLIATKAARITGVTKHPVADFGLRRAQGADGGLSASRAAYVGGVSSTSNVLAGKHYGIPVSGTHSHAWVMSFASELEAFRAYVESFPHNAVLLIDTYDTLRGAANALIVAREMRERGQQLAAVRIDSGDLAWLSIKVRALLDEAGFEDIAIIASNDLDEHTIMSLEAEQNARIDSYGVGTRLVVGWMQPSLGMVYKLSALRTNAGSPAAAAADATAGAAGAGAGAAANAAAGAAAAYTPVLKVSEQTSKSTLPGVLSLRRYFDNNGMPVGDMIYDVLNEPLNHVIVDPLDPLRQKDLSSYRFEELLAPLARAGALVSAVPNATQAREHARKNLTAFPLSVKRLLNPHTYPVGLETQLLAARDGLLKKAQQQRTG